MIRSLILLRNWPGRCCSIVPALFASSALFPSLLFCRSNHHHHHHPHQQRLTRFDTFPSHSLHRSPTDTFTLYHHIQRHYNRALFIGRCVVRFVYLLVNFTPLLISLPIYIFCSNITFISTTYHLLLLGTLERCGPTFIKLGQWISTRPDIFPLHLAQTLGKLHDSVPIYSFQKIQQIITDELGMKTNFKHIDPVPIGSGCIAQVHIGTFENGDKVAIKVQRPGISHLIECDLSILRFFAGILNRMPTMHWLSLPEEAEQFQHLMKAQLDLRVEADNLCVFLENFAEETEYHFPRPIQDLVTDKVLVEEFIDGAVTIGKFTTSTNSKLRNIIAELGLNAFLKMMIIDNFIHADLHPGNILVKFDPPLAQHDIVDDEGKLKDENIQKALWKGHRPILVFIDAGLITTLTNENMTNFIDLFTAIADGDGSRAARLMVERSRRDPDENDDKCRDFPGFDSKMQEIIRKVQQKTFQLANVNIGDILKDVFTCVREHHVKIESDFTNLIVSIIVLEGLGRQLNPDIDLFEAARPFLRFRKREFYLMQGGVFLKLSAFLEARFWLKKQHSEEEFGIVDSLIFNNW